MFKDLRTRLFISFIVLVCMGLFLPLTLSWRELHTSILADMKEASLREVHVLAKVFVDEANRDANPFDVLTFINQFASKSMRITFIDVTGKVLADSDVLTDNLSHLENHSKRSEFIDAVYFGKGTAARYSRTLGVDLVYAAEKLPQTKLFPEGILRIAVPTEGIAGRLDSLGTRFLGAGLLILFIAFLFTQLIYHRLKQAINDMQEVVDNTAVASPTRRPALPPRPEFNNLAKAVSAMTSRVAFQIRTIASQKAQIESILNSMNAGVLVLGERGRISRINPALTKLLPACFDNTSTCYENMLPIEVIQNADLQNAINALIEDKNKETSTLQLRLFRKVFHINLTKPDYTDFQEIEQDVTLVLVFHDITEIAQLIDIKRDLVANVSHELRTPLTAIQGYAETLCSMQHANMSKEESEQQEKFLKIIMKNSSHMNRIVQDLLMLSALENDSSVPANVFTDSQTAFVSALEECLPQLQAKNLTVENLLTDVATIAIDTDRLSQIFRNLLENAIRYSDFNSIIVVQNKREEKNMVITVQDFGSGIPEGDIARIFERFYRVEKHRGNGSTGLGLSLCKHMVEKFNGSIHAQYNAPALILTTQAVGATIQFVLPLYQA